MSQVIATVVAVTGKAYLRTADGLSRPIERGDVLHEGETIVTESGGRVDLALGNGELLRIPPAQTVLISAEMSTTEVAGADDSAVAADAVERVIQALESGRDPFDELDAPAAGNAAGGGEGNDFVRLLRIAEGVDPLAFEFGAAAEPEDQSLVAAVGGQAPLAVDDSASTEAGQAIVINVLDNDVDPDGDALAVVAVAGEPIAVDEPVAIPEGTVALNPDGSLRFSPNPGFEGNLSFEYTISDGSTLATAQVSVAVVGATDAVDSQPLAVDDSVSTVAGNPVSGDLAANDSPSSDGGNVWALVDGPANGSVVVNADGSYTYTPGTGFAGQDRFSYSITDADGDVSIANVTVTVVDGSGPPIADDSPLAVDDSVSIAVGEVAGGSLADNDIPSTDGGNVWALGTPPQNGTAVVNADGSFSYTPVAGFSGQDSFTYTVTDVDGDVGSATVFVSVGAPDSVPVAEDDSFTVSPGTTFEGNLAENDTPSADGGNVWSIDQLAGGGEVVVNADGSFSYTPDEGFFGIDSFTYTITDGDGDVSTGTVTIDVVAQDGVPVAVDDSFVTDEGVAVGGDLAANDTPSSDGGDAWALAAAPTNGTVTVNVDGTFTYTPNPGFSGTDSFDYRITDADGDVSVATATITVNEVANRAPDAVDDGPLSTDEDTPLAGIDVLANDSDVDGDALTVVSASSPDGSVTINADNTLDFAPNPDFHGPTTIQYTIEDGNGGSDSATVTIDVVAVNDPPVANDDSASTPADTPLTIAAAALLANDTDVDGDLLSIASVGAASNGSVVLNADGSVTFTPAAGFSGTASFDYVVGDGNGGFDTATATVEVSAAVNTAPDAVDDGPLSTDEDTPLTGLDVLANDSDADGDALTVVSASSPDGNVTINADNTLDFAPNPDFHGPTTIQYTIEDGNGGSDSATVTIDVVAVNDPPVANDDSASTPENTAITVDVLANDSDVDGALVPATVQIVGGPAHGSVVVNADGTVTYSPDANYNGPDSFSYTVADDGGGVSNAASVAVTTTPVEVPVFAEISVDQASVSEGGTLIYSVTLKDANGDPVPVAAGNMVEVALDWSGPASLGDDTSALPTSVTIVAGADSVDIAVVAIDDFLAEGSEALIATITAATDIGGSFDALLVGAVATASSAIVDDIGSEDPVFALVEGPETVAEGDTGSYLIKLVDGDGLPVSVPADTIVTVRFTNGTAEDDDYQYGDGLTADFTIPAGASTVSFPVSTVDDAVFEADEDFTVSIDSLATAAFERIDTSSTLTTRIIDDDSFAADGITGDDDDVNENVDSNVANDIIHQGTIGAVAEDVTLSIDTDVVGGFTSNGVPIGYAWDAGTRTLTATAGATLVFTVILSPANDSYSFQQFAAIDHPLLPGEDHSLDIPLSLLAHDDDGVQIASAPIALTIWDDAPEVTGTKTIVTANDGSHKETGTLTEVTVSNDITELAWDTSALPSLVFDGKPVQVIDHGDGRLTGELADGTLVFRVSIDPALVDANDSPQYSFELLNPLGRLGVEGTAESYTVITGGNIDTLALAFGNFLIDTMTATASDGSSATVNTNNSWIGIGGNWFDPSEVLFMDFTDPSGADGEVRGLDMVVEGQGGAPYELQWTVTAAIDLAGNTISYSGSVSGAGNGDLPFQIGLQDGALYFTDVTITDVSGNFRVAFALLTANDYESGIPLELGYVLTDADGDVATGILDIDLTAATGVSLTGGNDADSLVGTSSDDQIFGLGGNDLLVGGAGSDHLDGGSGDDRILGGSGDDELLGGLGADTFAWSLADSGASGSPNQDSILDFDTAASGGDILDLHDLLQGESGATLTDFLHFEQTASGTVLHVSKNGGFAGGYSAAQENLAISLDGVDLFGGGLTTDQQVIQDLLSKGKLITD